MASILDDDPFALRSDLNEARNRLQSRIEELRATEGTYHAGVPAQPSPLEPFDARLTRALVEEVTERKGHKFVTLDVAVIANDTDAVMHARHTAIYEPRRR